MDVVRSQLLFGEEGIPLGLLTAKFRFVDIRYLASLDFRAGSMGFQRLHNQLLFTLLIGVSALVAALSGPSSALLLIPGWHDSWPAGSATFWVNEDLSPSTVDRLSTWDPRCFYSPVLADYQSSTNSTPASCIWAGYPFLADAFRQ
jgi:hypothetical protein